MSGFQWVKCDTIVKKPEYDLEFDTFVDEENTHAVFAHIVVHKWSASVLKDMLATFKEIRKHILCPLFANASEIEDPKWEKFVRQFGFRPIGEMTCNNGVTRKLFVHIVDEKEEQK